MKNPTLHSRLALAALLALAVAGSPVVAQGNRPGAGPAAPQPVGSLQIDSLGGAPTPIYGFGFEVTNPTSVGSGGGAGSGKATLEDVEVVRVPDALSPLLFRAAVLGNHLATVRIAVFASGRTAPETTYLLSDVIVSASRSSNGLDTVSFAFRSIEVSSAGSDFCFDVAANSPC